MNIWKDVRSNTHTCARHSNMSLIASALAQITVTRARTLEAEAQLNKISPHNIFLHKAATALSLDRLREIAALAEFNNHIERVFLDERVDVRQHERVPEPRQNLDLAFGRSLVGGRHAAKFQLLEREYFRVDAAAHPKHDAERALADLFEDLIVAHSAEEGKCERWAE